MTTTGYGSAAAPELMPEPPSVSTVRPLRKKVGVTRIAVLAVCAIYFFGPLITAFIFTIKDNAHGGITFSAYSSIFEKQPGGQIAIATALRVSLTLAVLTILITLLLMIPTQLLLHLKYRRVRPVVEIITLLPLVFPPVVLVVGVSDTFIWTQDNLHGPVLSALTYLRGQDPPYILALIYVTLALPFVYRALDAGLRSIDTTTLVEAARNLGAGWPTVIWRVLMPSLRTSIVNASFLCFALVMGEYTIASILLYGRTFPVWLVQLPSASGQVQAATSLLSLLIVEIMLLLIGALNWRRGDERTG
jgi:ABC-type spermidine/putrescine transport system permease subunit II